MKRFIRTLLKIFAVLGFLSGLALLFYPWFSNAWNQYNNNLILEKYEHRAQEKFVDESLVDEWKKAYAYNKALQPIIIPDSFIQAEGKNKEDDDYDSCLNINGDGMMGYIYIPKIKERIPIYHSTRESVLQSGVGHIHGSSLPVGGTSTHAALAAHRGLPGAALFTDLDLLEKSDQFYLYILDDVLVYEVDQILIVEPTDTEPLQVEEGKDLVTLVTCTPYGVNSQRLLVRGHRVAYDEQKESEQEEMAVRSVHTNYAIWIVGGLIVTGMCIFLCFVSITYTRKNRKKR